MSTSDPGTSERTSAERAALSQASDTGVQPGESLSLGTFALPDPAVITRLANEFFAALPAAENPGVSAPALARPGGVPAVPSPPTDVPASPQALAQPFSEIPQSPAVPGSTGYVFDRISPLNATPSFPSLNDAFLFPGVPGAQAMPGVPGMPATTPGMPLTESDLRSIPASLGSVPAFAPGIPSASLPMMDSSPYFLDFDKAAPLAATPSFPDVAGMFSFPGVPLSGVPVRRAGNAVSSRSSSIAFVSAGERSFSSRRNFSAATARHFGIFAGRRKQICCSAAEHHII